MRIARPAIRPSLTIFKTNPAAFRALPCPTIPSLLARGSRRSSRPSPRMWECAPARVEMWDDQYWQDGRTYALHAHNIPELGGTSGNSRSLSWTY